VIIEQKNFGYALRRGADAELGRSYRLPVFGRKLVISDSKYVRIVLPDDRRIYLSMCHNASAYFAFTEHKEGRLTGKEIWLHADHSAHPDNNPIDEERCVIGPRTSLRRLSFYLNMRNGNLKYGVSSARVMTALQHKFPSMTFDFLHNGAVKVPMRGEGMTFREVCTILDFVPGSMPPNGYVLGFDVDMLSGDVTDKDSLMAEKAVSLAGLSKLVTVCLSPSYIDPGYGLMWMEYLVNWMIWQSVQKCEAKETAAKWQEL